MSTKREILFRNVTEAVRKQGYPEELGLARPGSLEMIVDEALAISEERDRWAQKKAAEYYNSKYTELLNGDLFGEADDGTED